MKHIIDHRGSLPCGTYTAVFGEYFAFSAAFAPKNPLLIDLFDFSMFLKR
jgi:hypothetical protein